MQQIKLFYLNLKILLDKFYENMSFLNAFTRVSCRSMSFTWRSSIAIIALVDPLMELYVHFNTIKAVIETGVD